jgi:hypothetical protein
MPQAGAAYHSETRPVSRLDGPGASSMAIVVFKYNQSMPPAVYTDYFEDQLTALRLSAPVSGSSK